MTNASTPNYVPVAGITNISQNSFPLSLDTVSESFSKTAFQETLANNKSLCLKQHFYHHYMISMIGRKRFENHYSGPIISLHPTF